MNKKDKIVPLKCMKCRHKWIPKTRSYPTKCPHCGSDTWDVGKEGE